MNKSDREWVKRPSKKSELKKTEPKKTELKKSDNGWKPSFHNDSKPNFLKEAQGFLNKMTYTTFDALSDKFVEVANDNPNLLKQLIDKVFEQSLLQPAFCPMYAKLCLKLHRKIKVFRKELLMKCQEEFVRGTQEPPSDLTDRERNIMRFKAKKRMLGNIKFIGELFKCNILVIPVMYSCFDHLLEENDEENIEGLCKLLTNVGKIMDQKVKSKMDNYFDKLNQTKTEVSNRIRFMIEDLNDLRKKDWN